MKQFIYLVGRRKMYAILNYIYRSIYFGLLFFNIKYIYLRE